MKQYILALDEGTTSARSILFDRELRVVSMAQHPIAQKYPHPGWVEQDPMEIYANQYASMTECVARCGVSPEEIAGIGITNQRETAILWERASGRPVCNAIVWQCRRTAGLCEELERAGHGEYIRAVTGLRPDAYFSGTKIKWMLDHIPGARARAEAGELLFGTVDSWLVWKLTGGRVHVTDATNASRTMLYDIGRERVTSSNGLLTTVAATCLGDPTEYALEGSVFVAGAVIQWLRDELHLINEADDSQYFAEKLTDSGGVYVVPAFTGLGAPYWDMHTRGAVLGLSRGTGAKHLIRAALESVAYQTNDVIRAMEADMGALRALRVDGGAAANDFLMQFQADISDLPVFRPESMEATARGAASLAGLACGLFPDRDAVQATLRAGTSFTPSMSPDQREALLSGWHRAVEACRVF